MERNRRLLLSLMILLLAALPSSVLSAEIPGAGDAVHFLRDGLGASGRGVGSAYVALANDYTAAFWNPAPVVQSPSTVVGGGLEHRNGGLFTFNVLGGLYAAETWSGGLVILASDLYDVYHVAGGVRFGATSIGLAIKSYQFGIPGERGSGLGLDVGARCTLTLHGSTVLLAVVSHDIGWTPIRWSENGLLAVDRAAWVHRLAVAVAVPLEQGEWTLEFDGELATRRPPGLGETAYWEQTGELNLSMGTVFRWRGLRIRGGVQRLDLLGSGGRFRPTVGLGVDVGALSIDLAFVPSVLGPTYMGGFEVCY